MFESSAELNPAYVKAIQQRDAMRKELGLPDSRAAAGGDNKDNDARSPTVRVSFDPEVLQRDQHRQRVAAAASTLKPTNSTPTSPTASENYDLLPVARSQRAAAPAAPAPAQRCRCDRRDKRYVHRSAIAILQLSDQGCRPVRQLPRDHPGRAAEQPARARGPAAWRAPRFKQLLCARAGYLSVCVHTDSS
jgi:hypothetical protein